MGKSGHFGLDFFIFRLFFFFVAVGTVVKGFGENAVVAAVDDDAFYFGAFFPACVAFDHKKQINKRRRPSQPRPDGKLDFAKQFGSIVSDRDKINFRRNEQTMALAPANGTDKTQTLQDHLDQGQQLLVPKKMFFTKGVGSHKHELRSFEIALRDAGIEKCNIVHVSSIFPPNCELISKNEGQKYIFPGMITFAVTARTASNEARRLIAASIGCAIPSDRTTYGYLSEHYAFGQTEKEAGDTAEDLAAAMLASTLGIDIDEDKSWDEKEEIFRISDKVVKTTNCTQSAMVEKGGYTTVVAAGVFIF